MLIFAPLGFALLSTSGCALQYADSQGNINTVGLVWTKHQTSKKAPSPKDTSAKVRLGPTKANDARWISTSSFGLTLGYTPDLKGVNLGYQQNTWLFPHKNGVTHFASDSNERIPELSVDTSPTSP